MALPASSAAVQQSDATPGYYFMLGRHLESIGKIDEAIAAHKHAIALQPDSAELRAELAGLYARQDRAREALDTAEEALARDPDNPEANRVLGSVYAALAEQKKPFRPGDDPSQYASKALAALTKAHKDGVFDVSLELMLGRLELEAGHLPEAIASLRRVVDDQPGYPQAAMLLAAAQSGAGDDEAAIRTLQAAVQASPTFLRGYMRLAEIYEQAHRYKDAANAYAAAQSAAGAQGIDLTTERATALLSAADPAAARDLLQARLAEAQPAGSSMLFLLGQAQRQLKDAAGAAATARKLESDFPNDPRGVYLSAQLLADAGRAKEALAAYQQLLTLAPGNSSIVYEYADLLEKNGRPEEAERALRGLVAKDPLDADALNSLGYLLAERGERLEEAVDLLQRALKIEPGNPSYLDSLGWAYFQQGRLDLADPPLVEAASKSPSNSVIQDHLGDLRMKQRRYADAAAAWERALAGDGGAIDRAAIERKLREARTRK